MNVQKVMLLFFFIFCFKLSFCQIWPKAYLPNEGTIPWSVVQSYDKGYLIGGWYVSSDGFPINGLLIKTTMTGEMLWYKTLGDYNDGTGVLDVKQTNDNGLIVSGATKKTDSWGDPFVMKINSCGDTEWCRIYAIGQDKADRAVSIQQIPGGYIAYIFYGYELTSKNKTHVFRLDQNGDLIWQQLYGQSDSLMWGTDGYDMKVTSDYHYLINGFCYYPDSGTINPKYLRPLIIKIDSSGTADWELPWSNVNGESFHGESYRSILDNQQNIYSCGRHIESSASPPGDRPTMLKTDSSGNEISYHDLVPNSWQAVFFNINWFQDSTIAIDGGWILNPGGEGQVGVFKVDKNGNILDSANIMRTVYCFSDAIVDHDNKLFLVQGQYFANQWHTYSWKLNSDLEYDTLYTHPFVYDSLCPHPIVSDTIPLDCIIVGIDEPFKNPETGKLKVFPNPTRDVLHIVIPEQLKTETTNPVFNLTTVYHQWKSATVEVYDLFGRIMYSKEVDRSDKTLDVDVSTWGKGMYVVRLVYNGQTVGSGKVMVE